MKRIILSVFLLGFIISAFSQKVYFVYLQSEKEQPFFVKMNSKQFSSTASGYLILPNLRDSTYNLSIGFPQSKIPEQDFTLSVNKKDHGFLLKSLDEKGWGLLDLQNSSLQPSQSKISNNKDLAEKQNSSAFTDILSKAADDPSLKEKTVKEITIEKKPEIISEKIITKEEIKPLITEQPPAPMQETKIPANDIPLEKKGEIKTDIPEIYKPTIVTKKSESSNVEGFGLVFIDESDGGIKDTIRLLIPNPKVLAEIKKEDAKDEKKFLELLPDTSGKISVTPVAVVKDSIVEIKPELLIATEKINCSEIATDSDFFQLRKNMAAEITDGKMIAQATKYFNNKCFTTLQIKNLSALFLNDEGKYRFFDAAYIYVSDAANYATLQSEFKDEYYLTRFKAMLR